MSFRRPLAASAVLTVMLTGWHAPSAAAANEIKLQSADLTVTVAKDFPRILGYKDKRTGAELGGSTRELDTIEINGEPYQVTAQADHNRNRATYKLTFPDLANVALTASLEVDGRVTTFKINKIGDTAAFRVGTIDIPGHDLISVSSDDEKAATAFTTLDADSTRTADRFDEVTGDTPADEEPVGVTYAIVNTGRLAAAIESNSSYDKPAGETDKEQARFWHQAQKDGDVTRVGVWSGQWTHRADTAQFTEETPWAKVIVTPDANGDGTADWQDGAMAFRQIGIKPKGWRDTKNRVISHIPFNFASQATHPFLRTLDDVKRISLATDGLGQRAILKGYGSEGHDSAHPDYGGNYNTRAGGLKDLNILAERGKKWNATFGVHIQNTESYPEAKNFSEDLVDKSRKGWNWLDQSYYIDQRKDLANGGFAKRLKQLRTETDPNLSFLYFDVFYPFGWLSDRHQKEIGDLGWNFGTEWSYSMERNSLWSHWANDLNYGGKTNKGLNSQIIRFIRNHEKDVWNDDPILGQTAIEEFEGWTGETDWNTFYKNIWERNLPAKYLQQFQIRDWDNNEIEFTGGVRGTTSDGKREIFKGDAKVIDGDRYLIPWDGEKLYHYNPAGGDTTWTLPKEFAGAGKLNLYKLTTHGRVSAGSVPVSDGKVTIKADDAQPYVLTPDAGRSPNPRWGEGSPLEDPGFNGTLAAWNPTGDVQIETTDNGHRVAALDGTSSISQQVKGVKPGTYSASAWIEIEPGQTHRTTLSAGGTSKNIDRSTAKNWMAADEKHSSYFQRVATTFYVKKGEPVTLRVRSTGRVRVDDVRLARTARATGTENFEQIDQGWGPFVKGDAGDIVDPRTHLSERHEPYTQKGWNSKLVDDVIAGDWSLKSHEENAGLVYRTVPQTVPLTKGHTYRIEFDYQNAHGGAYQWVTGYDKITGDTPEPVETDKKDIPQQRETAMFVQEITVTNDDTWVGLRKLDGNTAEADFILDNFRVIDLGP